MESVFLGTWGYLWKRRAWSRDAPSPHKLGTLPHKSSCYACTWYQVTGPQAVWFHYCGWNRGTGYPADTLLCQCFPSCQRAPHHLLTCSNKTSREILDSSLSQASDPSPVQEALRTLNTFLSPPPTTPPRSSLSNWNCGMVSPPPLFPPFHLFLTQLRVDL